MGRCHLIERTTCKPCITRLGRLNDREIWGRTEGLEENREYVAKMCFCRTRTFCKCLDAYLAVSGPRLTRQRIRRCCAHQATPVKMQRGKRREPTRQRHSEETGKDEKSQHMSCSHRADIQPATQEARRRTRRQDNGWAEKRDGHASACCQD